MMKSERQTMLVPEMQHSLSYSRSSKEASLVQVEWIAGEVTGSLSHKRAISKGFGFYFKLQEVPLQCLDNEIKFPHWHSQWSFWLLWGDKCRGKSESSESSRAKIWWLLDGIGIEKWHIKFVRNLHSYKSVPMINISKSKFPSWLPAIKRI